MKQAILPIILWSLISQACGIVVHVRHSYDGKPLLTESLRYRNAAGETLSVTRLSYLLSGFEVQDAEGTWSALPDQHAWIDATKRRTNFQLRGTPQSPVRGLRFRVGPDANTNGTDPQRLPADHPLNPNLNGLHWSWQTGYIFLAIEGHFRAAGSSELSGYSYHFANNPNRTTITVDLPEGTDPIALGFDLAPVLGPIHIASQGASTHSREGDPIAAGIKKHLPGAWSLISPPQNLSAPPEEPKPLPKYPPRSPDQLYRFSFDPKFSFPNLPTDNPMTVAGVALGQKLFHAKRLSRDNSISCASCHQATHGFSDPRQFSLGVGDRSGKRNSMPLTNLAWKDSFFWDGRAASLREQVLHPIQDPLEMDQTLEATVAKLRDSDEYPGLFAEAFGVAGIDAERLALALEQFLLSLTSYRSKFDLAMRGEAELSEQEKRGFELFFTEYEPRAGQFGADCFHCHGGAMFTHLGFENNGLDESFTDIGLAEVTGKASDRGKFSVPSLRNVALTAPYMHDGRFATLEEVVDHYDHGLRRSPTLAPNLAKHPAGGLGLSAEDRAAVVAFLKTLTEAKD